MFNLKVREKHSVDVPCIVSRLVEFTPEVVYWVRHPRINQRRLASIHEGGVHPCVLAYAVSNTVATYYQSEMVTR